MRRSLEVALQCKSEDDSYFQIKDIARVSAKLGDIVFFKQLIQATYQLDSRFLWTMLPKYAYQLGDTQLGQALIKQATLKVNERKEYYGKALAQCSVAKTFIEIGDTISAQAHLQKAFQIVSENPNIFSFDYFYMIGVAKEARDRVALRQAAQAFNRKNNLTERSKILSYTAEISAEIGDSAAAAYLQQAIEPILQIKRSSDQSSSLIQVVKSAVQIADISSLHKCTLTANQMEEPQDKYAVFRALGKAFAELGNTSNAYACLKISMQTALQIENKNFQALGLLYIAQTFAEIGDTTSAKTNLHQSTQAISQVSDQVRKYELWRRILKAFSDLRDTTSVSNYLSQAAQGANLINNPGKQVEALSNFALIFAEINDIPASRAYLEKALQVAGQIGDLNQKSLALKEIAQIADILGDINALQLAVQFADQISDQYMRSYALRYIAQSIIKSGNTQLLKKLEESTKKLSGAEDRSRIMEPLVAAYLKIGSKEKAYQMVLSMPVDNIDRAWSYWYLLKKE